MKNQMAAVLIEEKSVYQAAVMPEQFHIEQTSMAAMLPTLLRVGRNVM
jgi:hypothetical protein